MNILPRLVAGLRDGVNQKLERLLVPGQVRREASLVADRGRKALLFQQPLERVIGLGAHAKSVGEAFRPDGNDHEFLDVNVVVRVRPAVQDVHHRHRQQMGVAPADVAVQGLSKRNRSGAGDGFGDRQNRVRTQPRLVLGAVQRDERLINCPLGHGIPGAQMFGYRPRNICHGLQNALAAVTLLVAVAKLGRFGLASGRSGWNRSPADRPVRQVNGRLDRWIAPRIKDFSPPDHLDGFHLGDEHLLLQ